MGIDRIGKGGGLPPMPTTGGADASNATGSSQGPSKTFQVERTSGQAPAERAGNVEGASGASPLERLRAGEIDVHGYIDLKVDQATAGLSGLSPSELAHIKNTLRDQMASDPGLADLVRAATGQTPKLPEED